MKQIFSIFTVIFLLFCVATSADTNSYIWQNGKKTDLNKIADAKTLLGEKEHADYLSFLEKKDCDSAASILNKAFVERYPDHAFAKESGSYEYLVWKKIYSKSKYIELAFCFHSIALEALEEKRNGGHSNIGIFHPQDRPANDNEDWEDRDWNIRHIVAGADDGYLQALVYLAGLAKQGDVFNNSKEAEFFLLARACARNHRCADFISRLRELEAQFPKPKSLKLKRMAVAKNHSLRFYFNGIPFIE